MKMDKMVKAKSGSIYYCDICEQELKKPGQFSTLGDNTMVEAACNVDSGGFFKTLRQVHVHSGCLIDLINNKKAYENRRQGNKNKGL